MRRSVGTAAAAAAGGFLWAVKAAAVLAGAEQPPYLFEVAPVAFATAALLLSLELPDAERRTPQVLAAVAVASTAAAAVSAVAADGVWGPASLAGILLTLASLGLTGWRLDRRSPELRHPRWAFGIAVGTIPAVLAGGVLSTVTTERFLEVPILVLGLAWIVLGGLLSRAGGR